MSEAATIERNPIPLHERIAVKASEAAALMSCSRSTFFARVKAGIYPKPGPDGTMGCAALGGARGTRKALQINSLRNPYHSGCHSTRRAWRGQGALSHGGHTSSIQCPSSMDRITSCQRCCHTRQSRASLQTHAFQPERAVWQHRERSSL